MLGLRPLSNSLRVQDQPPPPTAGSPWIFVVGWDEASSVHHTQRDPDLVMWKEVSVQEWYCVLGMQKWSPFQKSYDSVFPRVFGLPQESSKKFCTVEPSWTQPADNIAAYTLHRAGPSEIVKAQLLVLLWGAGSPLLWFVGHYQFCYWTKVHVPNGSKGEYSKYQNLE